MSEEIQEASFFWIEVREDGALLQYTASPDEPRAMHGGTVHRIPGRIDPTRCLYIDGEIVDLGDRPSYDHWLDPVARAWAVPGKTALQAAMDAKWAEIRDERDRRERDVFPYLGKWLQCDVVSCLRMSGAKEAAAAAIAAGVEFSETWTCADNTKLPMTAHEVLGMLPALALWSSGLHATGRDLRTQIEACVSLEDVAAVVWPS